MGIETQPLPTGKASGARAELSSVGLELLLGKKRPFHRFLGDSGTLQWDSYTASSQKETSHPATQLFQREGKQFKTASAHLLCK